MRARSVCAGMSKSRQDVESNQQLVLFQINLWENMKKTERSLWCIIYHAPMMSASSCRTSGRHVWHVEIFVSLLEGQISQSIQKYLYHCWRGSDQSISTLPAVLLFNYEKTRQQVLIISSRIWYFFGKNKNATSFCTENSGEHAQSLQNNNSSLAKNERFFYICRVLLYEGRLWNTYIAPPVVYLLHLLPSNATMISI